MRLGGAIAVVLVFAAAACSDNVYETTASSPLTANDSQVRFRPVHIDLEVGDEALAAYQIELVVEQGEAEIVGVEGGQEEGFENPPYYDPKALSKGRIVLGAFSTEASLAPGQRHRVATVHLREQGPPTVYTARVEVAAGVDGSPVSARPELSF